MWSAGSTAGGGVSSSVKGASYATIPASGRPAAAARNVMAAPEEWPNANGGCGPTAAATAARSSYSRSAANGWVSPLSPRPRRSYVTTVKRCLRSSGATNVWRVQNAPTLTTSGGPSPAHS